MKKYESKVLKILSNGDAVIELPEELCVELNWNVGDQLIVEEKNGQIHLRKNNGSDTTG